MDLFKELKELSAPMCASGDENQIAQLFASKLEPYCESIVFSEDGGVLASMHKHSTAKRVLVSAAMDQAGFITTKVRDNGTVDFVPLTRMESHLPIGSRMVLHTQSGPLFGIVPSIPPHARALVSEEAKKQSILSIGADNQRVMDMAEVGDRITFTNDFIELQNDLVASASLANRAFLVCLMGLAESMTRKNHSLYLGGSTGGKATHSGAAALASICEPEIGIVLEAIEEDDQIHCGDGPVICIGSTSLPKYARTAERIAAAEQIPVQRKALSEETYMDSWALQTAGKGVGTIVLGLPSRNLNSQYEIVSIQDVKNMMRMLNQLIMRIDEESGYGL